FLSAYTPTMSGNWAVYDIPLADFGGVNLANITLLGFWNLSSTAGTVTLTYGIIYLDDIHFVTMAPPPSGCTPSCTIDFESGGAGNAGFTWDVFENGGDTTLAIITNPDQSGINTSATVAQVTARQAGAFFAGAQTAHGDIGPLTLDNTNSTVTIMVWKPVISPVGIQFVNATNGAQPPVLVSNTVTNQWEELTFDFSPFFGLEGNVDADRIVIFPDWDQAGRTQDNVIYFDNISFSP
ncbi:MAG: hypothetical protein KJN95_02440, partial [Gammaproteobacteria bacterium]|nr:hypothetical protein [Gammaproteobacteria bacterium]MBT8437951.1 hypothetical protein [Gammaproteobacteria bacterium]